MVAQLPDGGRSPAGSRRGTLGALGAAFLAGVLLAPACAPKLKRPVPEPPPAPVEKPVEPSPPPPVSPPPPSEFDLTLEAALGAETAGDRAGAIRLYERAASLAADAPSRAGIRFALALLFADPASEDRNLERARAELNGAAGDTPPGPRAVEARLLAALLDELIALRAQTSDLKARSDEARSNAASLEARLAEKEKELAEIKKILLRDKGKP